MCLSTTSHSVYPCLYTTPRTVQAHVRTVQARAHHPCLCPRSSGGRACARAHQGACLCPRSSPAPVPVPVPALITSACARAPHPRLCPRSSPALITRACARAHHPRLCPRKARATCVTISTPHRASVNLLTGSAIRSATSMPHSAACSHSVIEGARGASCTGVKS